MKILTFLLILVAFCTEVKASSDYKNNALRKAFEKIVESLRQQNHMVSVVLRDTFSDASKKALFASIAEIPHVVTNFGDNSTEIQLNSSAIVLLDSMKALQSFNRRTILSATFLLKQQLFIYWQDEGIGVNMAFELYLVQYEYFLIEDEQSIRLITLGYYAPGICGHWHEVEVNKFDKSTGRWQHDNFWIDKFSNFHGCEIPVVIEGALPEYAALEMKTWILKITKCRGYLCTLVKDFGSASAINFNPYMSNKTALTRLPNPKSILIISSNRLNYKHAFDPNNEVLITRPLFYLEHFFTVPPGEEYDGYEKMVLPFDEWTWKLIGITFASAFITIFALRFVRSEVVNFVKGKLVSTPALNVLRALFGIAQIVCPTRNFARYLLMMFILFSLIIRTAYQGKMFEFLQKEMRRPSVKDIDEAIEQNFTFYTLRNFTTAFKNSDLAERANIVDNWTDPEFHAAYERSYAPGSKTSVVYQFDIYNSLIKMQLNRADPPRLLKDRYMLESRALTFRAHDHFFDIFNRKLQQYIEADLINFNNREWIEENNPKKFEENKKPFAVLTFKELEAGFVVCTMPMFLSIFVFFLEWILSLKDLMVFIFIFKTLFKVKDLEQTNHNGKMRVKVAAWQEILREIKMEGNESSNNLSSTLEHDLHIPKANIATQTLSAGSRAWSEDLESWFVDCQSKYNP